jgi:hypothetical protein
MIYYFYKIVSDDLPNFVYVGSTKAFANRKYQHKCGCTNENRKHYNLKLYRTIRANGGWNNWRMVCIHQQEVDNKRHAEQIEEQYRVELNGNMNAQRAFTTPEQMKEDYKERHKEWRENNPEYNKQYYKKNKGYYKEYRETNKESIYAHKKEKIKCECGCEVRRDNIAAHKRTDKHIKLMEDI